MRPGTLRRRTTIVALGLIALLAGPGTAGAETPRYAASVHPAYRVRTLVSVGDRLPRTGEPGARFRMVGRPDGLGFDERADGTARLWMSHELAVDVSSRPLPGEPAVRGAFVSAWRLDARGDPVSGDVAFDDVYQDRRLVGPLATETNGTPAFGRFCSGFFAGAEVGFDPPMYLASEEATAPSTFSPLGGQAVAIYGGEAHALSALGHLQRENAIVQPAPGRRTAIVVLEDGAASDSQLYLYLGRKDPDAKHPLVRNGLIGGHLFVFAAVDPGVVTEGDITSGTVDGRWVRIPGAALLDDVGLEEAADAAGALGFVRLEDGAFPPTAPHDFVFASTGGDEAAGNGLGRLYHLQLDPRSPRGPAALRLAYDADLVVGAGEDGPISPDNLEVVGGHLFVQEDATAAGQAALVALEREAGMWRFDLVRGPSGTAPDGASAVQVVTLRPPGRDGTPLPGPGVWESSGVLRGTHGLAFFDVMAHPPTLPPGAGTVEDGQLLLIRRV